MVVSFCVIARNEAKSIAALIRSVATQTIFRHSSEFEFVVICNGCSDDTADVARAALEQQFNATNVTFRVHDTPLPGKARSWNVAVHDVVHPAAKYIVFMDADIQIKNDAVVAHLISKLAADKDRIAVSGWPVKDTVLKERKSIIDRFSLRISSQTPAANSVNGSLYVGRAEQLRRIWLPVPTPGEDGFLSAMIHSNGFSEPAKLERIQRADWPTHYFEAHTVSGFFAHERRMTIGTTINGWICEKLWSGKHMDHVGEMIRDWNEHDPYWVSKIVSCKVAGRFWALPPRLLIWRLYNLRGVGLLKAVNRAPFSLLATLLNLWPCIQANRALKRQDAASIW